MRLGVLGEETLVVEPGVFFAGAEVFQADQDPDVCRLAHTHAHAHAHAHAHVRGLLAAAAAACAERAVRANPHPWWLAQVLARMRHRVVRGAVRVRRLLSGVPEVPKWVAVWRLVARRVRVRVVAGVASLVQSTMRVVRVLWVVLWVLRVVRVVRMHSWRTHVR